jgi:Phage tail protein
VNPIVTLNGFTFNPPAADGTGYELDADGIQGWYGSPKPRVTYTDRSSDAGSWFDPNAYDGPRPIVISGTLMQASSVTFLQAQMLLSAICPDPSQLYTLQVTDDLGTLQAQVQRSDAVLVKPLMETATAFSLPVTAPDPYKYDPVVAQTTTLLATTASGLSWPLDWTGGGTGGLVWGTSTSDGTCVITNEGTAPSWPIFTVNGPTDPGSISMVSITDTSTGQVITYGGTLNRGDALVIDTSPSSRSATLNSSVDVWSGLTTSQWFSVPAGGQVTVQFQGQTGSLTPRLFAAAPNTYY